MAGRRSSDADQRIAQKIRLLRAERAMSQQSLAAALGISFQQVQKYERGTNRVSAGRLYHVAQCLNVPVTYFFEGLSQGSEAAKASLGTIDGPIPHDTLRFVAHYLRIKDRAQRERVRELVFQLAKLGSTSG